MVAPVPGPVSAVVVAAVPAVVPRLATGGERCEHLSNSHGGSSLFDGGDRWLPDVPLRRVSLRAIGHVSLL
jgi:hypothetical protein